MLDTIAKHYTVKPQLTFIEPFPQRLRSVLRPGDLEYINIVEKKLQDVPMGLLYQLEAGDLLFVDSSHVVKCASDVQKLFFMILPVLPSGITVHFHDVFFPFEYPAEWLLEDRYWNENYFIRAFLPHNSQWSIHSFNSYTERAFKDVISEKMPLCLKGRGQSIYITRR